MKSFGQWFAEQSMPAVPPVEQELHPQLRESSDGVYMAHCCACGQEYEIFGTAEEFTDEGNYCGRSPSCCP